MDRQTERKEHPENNELLEQMKKMADTDIRKVDPDELVEIETVKIDSSLPYKERIQQYLEQIKNPYCYLCNGVVVKISFSGKEHLEECLAKALSLK